MVSRSHGQETRERRRSLLKEVDQALETRRQKVQSFVSEHQQRMAELESRCLVEFEGIMVRMSHWARFQDEFQKRYASFCDERKLLEQHQQVLDSRTRELEDLRKQTEEQRGRIAKELEDRRGELAEAQDSARIALESELFQAQESLRLLQQELLALRTQKETLQRASDGQREAATQLEQEVAELRHTLEQGQAEAVRLQQELDQALSAADTQRREMASGSADAAEHERELKALRDEHAMAMESVESLRDKNDRLEARLSELQEALDAGESARDIRSRSSDASDEDAAPLDWEAQKRRLLANLENSRDEDEASQIEDAIRRTEEFRLAKEAEITALRGEMELLQSQAKAHHSPTDTAREALLDADSQIVAERTRLAQLQSEMHEKLKQSEVECAKERAKNARLGQELEQKLRDLEAERSRQTGHETRSGREKGGRRWLEHLGLNGKDDKAKEK